MSARRRLWTSFEWPLVGALAILALGLGFVGFARSTPSPGQSRSFLDLVYRSLQLFALQSGDVPSPVPWELHVSRFLVPAVGTYAAIKALALLFREQFDRLRTRFFRGHIVIAGLGRRGLLLARALRRQGERVVVLETDAENDLIATARAAGVQVLIGDSRDPTLLRAAGVHKATHFVATTGEDGVNAEIAVQARKLVEDGSSRTLSCLVHVVDPDLCRLLRMQEMERPVGTRFRLDFFNVFEAGARALVEEHGIVPPHVLVVGLGQFGESVLTETARHWRDTDRPHRGRLRVTVVDRKAEALAASLSVRHPWLAQLIDLVPRQMDVASKEFLAAEFLGHTDKPGEVTMAFICLDDESTGLAAALDLYAHLRGRGVPIIVRTAHGAGLASLLEDRMSRDNELAELRAFGLLDRTCTPDLLRSGGYELIAREIHEEYQREQARQSAARRQADEPSTASEPVPWDELREHLKESNRAQAAHVGVKLAAIGCDLAPLGDEDGAQVEFREAEIELLAVMEHGRWMEERLRAGWKPGPREVDARTSPYLVPWSELDENVRDYDRAFARALPRILSRAGLRITRRGGEMPTRS